MRWMRLAVWSCRMDWIISFEARGDRLSKGLATDFYNRLRQDEQSAFKHYLATNTNHRSCERFVESTKEEPHIVQFKP